MAVYQPTEGGSLHNLSLPQLLALRALMQRARGGLAQRLPQGAGVPGAQSVLAGLSGGRQAGAAPPPSAQAEQQQANIGGQIAWGGQRFSNPAEVAAWINARGGHTSGQQFLQNHPALWATQGRPTQAAAPEQMPAATGAPAMEVPPGRIAVRPHIRRAPTKTFRQGGTGSIY